MPAFKAFKHKLTFLLGANNAVGDFKLKTMLIYYFRNPEDYATSSVPVISL